MKKPIKDEEKQAKLNAEGEKKANGLAVNKYVKKRALKQLPIAKQIEQNQIEAGYKWMKLNKQKRLVHPNKIQTYLEEGFTIIETT